MAQPYFSLVAKQPAPVKMAFGQGLHMAENGEWNLKGATLSNVTAKKEYGVYRDFIVKGIRADKLEYRDGAIWGNPYLRVLRRQLEKYITEELGKQYLVRVKAQTELRKIKKEISDLKKRLHERESRKTILEHSISQ
jgi:protoheme ferro-lyase